MSEVTAREVFVRGRQEATKWWDRMTTRTGRRAGSAKAPLQYARTHLARFFEGADHPDLTALAVAQLPECRARILLTSDAVCRGRFDLLGYRGLDYGDPVDWHLDPVSGRRAPFVHWSRLDPLDGAVVGDAKVVMELNRHQWMLHLGQAYRFTGDERYAGAFARYIQDWIRANPEGMGINWTSSLEVAFRLISWCWALVLFDDAPTLSDELGAAMLAGIEAHARHVGRYLSYYSSPNTHLTGEALGLLYAGVFFPKMPRARQWQSIGTQILIEQCERQILDDGVYFEQSTCYQRYTAEIYLHFLILAARNGIDVPDVVADRLQRLLDFLIAVREPNGAMPAIGDADGGWLLPLLPRASDDLRGVFSVAAAFFRRSDYAWAAGGVTPEVLWLLGSAGAETLETTTPNPPRAAPSRIFPTGGYAVMKSGWEHDAHQMIFDVGPLGVLARAGHGHADLLSVQCFAFGEPYLIDPGTYCYASRPQWQDYFRSTMAHSSIRVDGHEQAIADGPFKWQAKPSARLRRWLSTESFDFADAEHGAYERLPDPVTHRRRVLFIKPRYWLMIDDLHGRTDHQVELRFQFAPVQVTLRPDRWVLARGRSGRGLLIRPWTTVALTPEVSEGDTVPFRAWMSTDYGRLDRAPALAYTATTALPLRIATLIVPTVDPYAALPPVLPWVEEGRGWVSFVLWNGQDRIRLRENGEVDVSISPRHLRPTRR